MWTTKGPTISLERQSRCAGEDYLPRCLANTGSNPRASSRSWVPFSMGGVSPSAQMQAEPTGENQDVLSTWEHNFYLDSSPSCFPGIKSHS